MNRDLFALTDDTPVYVISVAAQLSGLHPQTLRQYDRLGLVSPGRAPGRGRRYSMRDIMTLREVQRLSQEEGINLAGIKRILELQQELDRARRVLAALRDEVIRLQGEMEATLPPRAPRASGSARDVAPIRRQASIVVWQPPQD